MIFSQLAFLIIMFCITDSCMHGYVQPYMHAFTLFTYSYVVVKMLNVCIYTYTHTLALVCVILNRIVLLSVTEN